MTPAHLRYLEIEGERVALTADGKALGPGAVPVVLLHGAGMDRAVWEGLGATLAARGHSTAAPDLPGHGLTEGELRTSVEDLGVWVGSLLDALEVDRAHLVGHSLGALVALDAAARYRRRVASLTMIGANAAMPVNPKLLASSLNELVEAAGKMARWCHARRPGAQNRIDETYAMLLAAPSGALAADLLAASDYGGARAAARTRACPTLLVLGAEDIMAPPAGALPLVEAIGPCTTAIVEHAGHMVMIDRPRDVASVLLKFLRDEASVSRDVDDDDEAGSPGH